MSPQLSRAGVWFLRSGIQESNGGVARYYRADLGRNHPISTEITGYAVSAFVYLHSVTRDPRYLDRAALAARFLTRTAWDAASRAMPFEIGGDTYFFDCGIVVRGLLAAWRGLGDRESCDVAVALGHSMASDFDSGHGDFHPILSLPDKILFARDPLRWSRTATCYQLKSAMAWWDLFEATGDARFREPYERVLESSLRSYGSFLPGHPDPVKVMDRLHAFCYFLEGMLPCASDSRCAAAICDGIRQTAYHLRAIAPQFERSDVYAQLLRMRLHAGWAGVLPLDREAAAFEAGKLAEFQAAGPDSREEGGYYFGRKGGAWMPFINPVSTAIASQALELFSAGMNGGQSHRHLLI